MDWREELASQVTLLFAEANHKQMPLTLEHWEEVAERFQKTLGVASCGQRLGVLLDDIVVVRDHPDQAVVGQRCAHEFAEYLLRSEWERPFCYESAVSSDAEVHRIARLVERRFVADRLQE